MKQQDHFGDDLAALTAYLSGRRGAILENWRAAVQGDSALATASTLARQEFFDHIPALLDAFENILRSRYLSQQAEAGEEQKALAAEHGLHRWHHGYNQQDVMREWGHLHLCLVNELENYAAFAPKVRPETLADAHRALARLCSEGVIESAARYAELQRIEAEGRIRDLERALEQLRLLDQRRIDTWRGAVHDLRGRFGVVKNISDLLGDDEADQSIRTEFLPLLQKSVGSLHGLLNNLLVLSRLEAGQERREIRDLDAAAVLRELCESFQPLAIERGLFLHAAGPASLPVQSDLVNVQRIAQNLLLNALKYTQRGGVRVSWQALETDGLARWAFIIEDTGPGMQAGGAAPLAEAIEASTEEAKAVEQSAVDSAERLDRPAHSSSAIFTAGTARSDTFSTPGEGIGLAIVKRLCELLDATIELQTEFGHGSVFRVILPRSYERE